MPPIILSATATRLEKLENASEYVPVRIKIPHSKLEITTVMKNPFYVDMHGDGFNLKNIAKGMTTTIHTVVPVIDKASDVAMLLEAASGIPQMAAIGAVGKATAAGTTALMGGSKKKL